VVTQRQPWSAEIELGCRLGQGWLLSAPVQLDEVTVMLPEPPALVGARALK